MFGIVGASGRLPSRFKFGDNEVVMPPPIAKAIADKIEKSEDPEEAEGLIAAVTNPILTQQNSAARQVLSQLKSNQYASAAIAGAQLETYTVSRLIEVAKTKGLEYHIPSHGHLYDFTLSGPEKSIGFIVTRRSAIPLRELEKFAKMAEQSEYDSTIIVLMTVQPINQRVKVFIQELQKRQPVHIVLGVDMTEIGDDLERVVTDLFN